jgi:chitin synthase
VLSPVVSVFLDAGCVPQPDSLYRLWEPLHSSDTVAAATGFCTPLDPSPIAGALNPILAFQRFEYQLTNTLERPVESLFGRRFALNKGGFVAYRYSVIAPDRHGEGVFVDYFAGERLGLTEKATAAELNAFLTEDRAIAASLLRTDLKVWRTVSVDSAEVVVDVPPNYGEFCLQRRRWIDGDLYSTLHELKNTLSYIRIRPWNFTVLPRIWAF